MCLELFNPKRIIKRVRSRESLKPYPWLKKKTKPPNQQHLFPDGLQQEIPLNFHWNTLKGAVRDVVKLVLLCSPLGPPAPPRSRSVLLLWKPSSALASMVLSFPAFPPSSLISFSTSFGGPSYLPPTFVWVSSGWVFHPHLFLLCILSLFNLSHAPYFARWSVLFLTCV